MRRAQRSLLAALALIPALGMLMQPATAAAAPTRIALPSTDARIPQRVLDAVKDGGTSTFWVMIKGSADLEAAERSAGKAKAAQVYRAKRAYADQSQSGVRQLLKQRKAAFTPYWIANTIKVTGNAGLLRTLAERDDVARVVEDVTIPVPKSIAVKSLPTVNSTEWNIDRIGAARVWSEYNTRGEAIVIANIDTGVQFDHPALAAGYRGRQVDGAVDHNYSWFDPSHVCSGNTPCDNTGHGTHTMGTMVGVDGDNVIGVAPQAKWIAAKGCESSSCSTEALLAAGQWIVAPTDLNGQNPRPDLAPDVVNNSWGGIGFSPWYSEIVQSWVTAGIFPAFSNGNAGPGCGTAGAPGAGTLSYASGAFDIDNQIAPFSSRGTGENGSLKPNIAAPGVNIRSSVPGGYAAYSGTSMASPHTAAAVALLWAATPSLKRDIEATREILDTSAIDVDDTSCGGTPAFNNVFGQGRLDVFAAMQAARTPSGQITGTVSAPDTSDITASVEVTGPITRRAATAANGNFRLPLLPAGSYRIRVSSFGFTTVTDTVTVTAGETARYDVRLQPAPSAILSGTVTSGSGPVAGAMVTVQETPLSARTDAAGRYRLTVPHGSYDVTVQPLGSCLSPETKHLELSGDTIQDFVQRSRTDRFGYTCARTADGDYLAGTEVLALTGDDAAAEVSLPFPVDVYGTTREHAWVGTNGVIGFSGPEVAFSNTDLPGADAPNDALYPFWDDLYVDADAAVYTGTVDQTFVVEWRNVRFFTDATQRLSISAELHRDGTITYRYRNLVGSTLTDGSSATIGIENADGTDGLAYAFNISGAVTDGFGISFTRPGTRSGPRSM